MGGTFGVLTFDVATTCCSWSSGSFSSSSSSSMPLRDLISIESSSLFEVKFGPVLLGTYQVPAGASDAQHFGLRVGHGIVSVHG